MRAMFVVQLICLTVVSAKRDREKVKSWMEAVQACISDQKELVSSADCEHGMVNATNHPEGVWLAEYYTSELRRLTAESPLPTAHVQTCSYKRLRDEEEINDKIRCDQKLKFVCIIGQSVRSMNEEMSWIDAVETCNSLGGYLATDFKMRAGQRRVWLGVYTGWTKLNGDLPLKTPMWCLFCGRVSHKWTLKGRRCKLRSDFVCINGDQQSTTQSTKSGADSTVHSPTTSGNPLSTAREMHPEVDLPENPCMPLSTTEGVYPEVDLPRKPVKQTMRSNSDPYTQTTGHGFSSTPGFMPIVQDNNEDSVAEYGVYIGFGVGVCVGTAIALMAMFCRNRRKKWNIDKNRLHNQENDHMVLVNSVNDTREQDNIQSNAATVVQPSMRTVMINQVDEQPTSNGFVHMDDIDENIDALNYTVVMRSKNQTTGATRCISSD